jgi:hypothetical protein
MKYRLYVILIIPAVMLISVLKLMFNLPRLFMESTADAFTLAKMLDERLIGSSDEFAELFQAMRQKRREDAEAEQMSEKKEGSE